MVLTCKVTASFEGHQTLSWLQLGGHAENRAAAHEMPHVMMRFPKMQAHDCTLHSGKAKPHHNEPQCASDKHPSRGML